MVKHRRPEKVKEIVQLKTNVKKAEIREIKSKITLIQGQKEGEIKKLVEKKIHLENVKTSIEKIIKKKRKMLV